MKAFKVHRNNEEHLRVDLPKHLFPDGKRRSAMGKTRREALERADQIVQKRKKGLRTEEGKASLATFLERFLEFYKTEGGVAPNMAGLSLPRRTELDSGHRRNEAIGPEATRR